LCIEIILGIMGGRGEMVNWEVPIGEKTLNTPLHILHITPLFMLKKKQTILSRKCTRV